EGPGVFDGLADRLHVHRRRGGRVRGRSVSRHHALVLQGAAVPRRRFGDLRDACGVSPHAQHMRNMGGLRAYMPVTFVMMWIATLAISGIPILAGFFSKDEILGSVIA